MSTFSIYTPLPSPRAIRLLCIHPGAEDTPLSCSLYTVEDFATTDEYHAISYCWGDQSDVQRIVCNDVPLNIIRTLYEALHRLRVRGQEVAVWADAICINQQDIAERNQQVSIMNHIYSKASYVYVWLGQKMEHIQRAMETIQYIARIVHEASGSHDDIVTWTSALSVEKASTGIIVRAGSLKTGDLTVTQWSSLWTFYQLDWFYRVWVIQEVHRSRNVLVLCGDLSIEWGLVAVAAAKFNLAAYATFDFAPHTTSTDGVGLMWTPSAGHVNLMWAPSAIVGSQVPFLGLLEKCRPFRASDPRDKVFALLHHPLMHCVVDYAETTPVAHTLIAEVPETGCTHLDILVDYNKSILETYCEVARRSILQYKSLEVLRHAWLTAHKDVSWPSWVPRWNMGYAQDYPAVNYRSYSANGQQEYVYHESDDPSCLVTEGLVIGRLMDIDRILALSSTEIASATVDTIHARLQTLSTLIVRSSYRTQKLNDVSDRKSSLQSFASFVLDQMGNEDEEILIPLWRPWCDACGHMIGSTRSPVDKIPQEFYNCNSCDPQQVDVCAACYDLGARCPDPDHVLQKSCLTYLCLPRRANVVNAVKELAVGGSYLQFRRDVESACTRTVFFRTSRGHLGSAYETVRAGDIVVILFGCRIPVVIRKHGPGYRLVSDCYVDGLMNGEAVEQWQNGDLTLREFHIV